MRDHYDFSGAIKNPYADKLKNGYTVVVEHENYDEIITVQKAMRDKNQNGNQADSVKEG
jgi:cell fate regulator YaaT (PSP1 superfamily)